MMQKKGAKGQSKKKPSSARAVKGKARTKGRTAKRRVIAVSFRERGKQDDDFVIQVTLTTMKGVYEKSVGEALDAKMVLKLLDDSFKTIIIECDGKPVGYYAYHVYEKGKMYWGALVLDPSIQGLGLGHKIAAHVEEEARLQGVHTIQGHVQVENKRALRFWESNGWQIVGRPVQGSYPIEKKLDV